MSYYSENDPRRKEYMKTLNLRAALDDRVLQAVKLNQLTGQVMNPPTDMRTIDEKLADVELLKSRVRNDLLTITDGANATAIMGKLTPGALRFVAQKFELMAREIRPKFALGITEPQFMNFLQDYILNEQRHPVAGRETGVNDVTRALQGLPTRQQFDDLATQLAPAAPALSENEARAMELGIPLRHANGRKKADRSLAKGIREAEESGAGASSAFSTPPSLPKAAPKAPAPRSYAEAAKSPSRAAPSTPAQRFDAALARDEFASGTTPPQSGSKAKRDLKFGKGMRGRGLVSPLGKNVISMSKLHDDIVQIRSKKGSVIPRLPTEKVSRGVASALRKVVEGGSLTVDDIEGLDEADRRQLHRIANRCECMDKVPISAPKDAESRMSDDFLRWRGEIVAGNDNPDLVRKFKLLILKMTQLDLLPKHQVREILVDLLSLGH